MQRGSLTGVRMNSGSPPSLFTWVGGAEKLQSLFQRFYRLVRVDPILAPIFADMPPQRFISTPVVSTRATPLAPQTSWRARHGNGPVQANCAGRVRACASRSCVTPD